MIQFNLLPDIKLTYVKTNRIKHLVVVVSSLTAVFFLAVMLLLFVSVKLIQAQHSKNLNNQITSATSKLKNTPDINQVLTIQNQLNVITSLHQGKPVVSRLPTYIAELTPASATISELSANYSTNTVIITGTADSLATVNQYIDTMKFSTYTATSGSTSIPAFSNVVLASFGYTSATGATYSISASFNPVIFSGESTATTLTVPNIVTTRSELDQPKILFQPQVTTSSSSTTTTNTTGTN